MSNFPYIKVSGNYRDIGNAIGLTKGDQIRKAVTKRESETPNYNHFLEQSKKYYTYTKTIFPQYIEELEAISKAAKVSPEKYFLGNCSEIFETSDHCTIAVSFGGSNTVIGHNEDWHIDALDSLYLLHATINGTTFFSLNYAGGIPGIAAGINSWKLVQCINSLNSPNQFGIPKNFIARALLESRTLDEVVELIKNTKHASGYNHVLIQENRGVNIEIAGNEISVDPISTENYVHTNHYLSHLRHLEKFHTQSSQSRYDRAIQLIKPGMSVQNMKDLLSDTKNSKFPICRPKETIASLVFEPDRGVIHIAKGHPFSNSYEEYSL